MKRYKYVGTEEQLVARGFVRDNGNSEFGYIWYDKDCIIEKQSHGDIITILLDIKDNRDDEDIRMIMFNLERAHRGEDITPYIQDLIDDGLVEVLS